MEEWKEYKLGDLCDSVCSGGTPSSKRKDYYDGNIPWLNTKEVNFNRIYSTERNITEDGLNNSSAKWISENSVIVAMYGATAGKTAIAKIPLTTNQACCNLSINSNLADYRFIYYYLCNKYTILASLANGGAQQNLNAQIIKDFIIKLPSLSEQNRISDILSSLDDKIENNRKINENIEQQAQALFKSWFVDFEPFRDQPFVESELGMIPEGWRVGTIISISKQVTDGVHNSVKDEPKSNYLLLSAKNIKNGELNISSNERRIDIDVFNQLRRRTKLSKGDILITSVGTIGEMLLLKEDPTNYEFQRSVAIIKPNDEIVTSEYVYLSLKSRLNDVKHMAHGAVQQCIFIGDMKDFKILIAPYFDILAFSSIVKPFYDQIKLNQDESHRLSHLRDTLLPKLMSGEIKL